jgi:hypothetical protein
MRPIVGASSHSVCSLAYLCRGLATRVGTLPALHPTVERPPLTSVATALEGSISGSPSRASSVAPWHRYARFGAGIPSLGQWRRPAPRHRFYIGLHSAAPASSDTARGRFGSSLRSQFRSDHVGGTIKPTHNRVRLPNAGIAHPRSTPPPTTPRTVIRDRAGGHSLCGRHGKANAGLLISASPSS